MSALCCLKSKSQQITKFSRIHPQETVNVCKRIQSNSCWDVSVRSKVLDWPTDTAIHRAIQLAGLTINFLSTLNHLTSREAKWFNLSALSYFYYNSVHFKTQFQGFTYLSQVWTFTSLPEFITQLQFCLSMMQLTLWGPLVHILRD